MKQLQSAGFEKRPKDTAGTQLIRTDSGPVSSTNFRLVEPQYDLNNAPVLLWLSGGPGCSGGGALLFENGPFLVNPDGQTLFENVYSWNKAAYVIYLDSPRGVGFSYQNYSENPDNRVWNDPLTAADIISSIKELYKTFPMLSGRNLYLTGESYAGVYVPTVAMQLIKELEKAEKGAFAGLDVNLRGMAIGNGFFSSKWIHSTIFDFAFFRGLISKNEWDGIRKCCQPPNELYCHIPEDSNCSALNDDSLARFLANGNHINYFNIYQQCYEQQSFGSDDKDGTNFQPVSSFSRHLNLKKYFFKPTQDFFKKEASHFQSSPADNPLSSQQILLNYGSNDASFGFPCYARSKVEEYFSQAHVREALHVPEFVQKWTFCNNTINHYYDHKYFYADKDMKETFQDILNSSYVLGNTKEPFRILIYNGDSDLVCSFLQAEFIFQQLVEEQKTPGIGKRTSSRQPWYYSQTSKLSVCAGFSQSFSFSSHAVLDVLTLKGAGHFATVERRGASLQMLSNFLEKKINYSQPLKYPIIRKHLKYRYEPKPASQKRTESSDTSTLPTISPGGTYQPKSRDAKNCVPDKSVGWLSIKLLFFFFIVSLLKWQSY